MDTSTPISTTRFIKSSPYRPYGSLTSGNISNLWVMFREFGLLRPRLRISCGSFAALLSGPLVPADVPCEGSLASRSSHCLSGLVGRSLERADKQRSGVM